MKTNIAEVDVTQDFSANGYTMTGIRNASDAQEPAAWGQVLALVQQLPIKEPVQVVQDSNPGYATYNQVLDKWTGIASPPTVDGISLGNLRRILITGATDARGNGIWLYTQSTGELTRPTDADNSTGNEVKGGIIVFATEGNTYQDKGWELKLPNTNVVLGTDSQVWEIFNQQSLQTIRHTILDKNFTSAAVSADHGSTGVVITEKPANNDYVKVIVNGRIQRLSVDGNRDSAPFYFSGDGGVTARTNVTLAAGDTLYCNPTVLTFNMLNTFKISLDYLKS